MRRTSIAEVGLNSGGRVLAVLGAMLLFGSLFAGGAVKSGEAAESAEAVNPVAVKAPPPVSSLAPSGQPYSETREPCAERDPLRKAYWGELHIHSTLSMDAWMWDVRGTPDEVYGFAKGEAIGLAPYGPDGKPQRKTQLERPARLRFADRSRFLPGGGRALHATGFPPLRLQGMQDVPG